MSVRVEEQPHPTRVARAFPLFHRLPHAGLVLAMLGAILVRIPSLVEPNWYGDEGTYLTIGLALRHGVRLYSGITDNKPPFIYMLAALANGRLFWFKFFALIFSVLTVVMIWKLARRWFGGPWRATIVALFFALLTSMPWFEGNIANAEIFFLLATVGSFYLIYEHENIAAAGLVLGLGALFKLPVLIEAGVWPVYWLMTRDRQWFRKSFSFGAWIAAPLVASGLYFLARGALSPYMHAAGPGAFSYLSTWYVPGFVGALKGRAVILGILIAVLWVLRKKISRNALLLSLLFLFELFASVMSSRPYAHYLLQLAPAMALGAGAVLFGRIHEKFIAVAIMAPMTLGAAVFFHMHFDAKRVEGYYKNFARYVTNQEDVLKFRAWFDPHAELSYRIASSVAAKTTSSDRIFVWADDPVVYDLARRIPAGRYTAAYQTESDHAESETMAALRTERPRVIVVWDAESKLPGLHEMLLRDYVRFDVIGRVKLYIRR